MASTTLLPGRCVRASVRGLSGQHGEARAQTLRSMQTVPSMVAAHCRSRQRAGPILCASAPSGLPAPTPAHQPAAPAVEVPQEGGGEGEGPQGASSDKAQTKQPRLPQRMRNGKPFPKCKPPQIQPLPPLKQCSHFLNLTNGIEAAPMLDALQLPYSFVRIQSTACEQQEYEKLLLELDSTLLVTLALGKCALIYDCGSRIRTWGVPRAQWMGVEFIRFALTRLWLGEEAALRCGALVRGYNCAPNYLQTIEGLKQSTVRRLRYYMKWIPPGLTDLRLHGVYRTTDHDSDTAFYQQLLYESQGVEPQLIVPAGGSSSATSGQDSSATTRGAVTPSASSPASAGGKEHSSPEVQGMQGPGVQLPTEVVEAWRSSSWGQSSEALLESLGWSVYYRGLNNQEWKAFELQRSQGLGSGGLGQPTAEGGGKQGG